MSTLTLTARQQRTLALNAHLGNGTVCSLGGDPQTAAPVVIHYDRESIVVEIDGRVTSRRDSEAVA